MNSFSNMEINDLLDNRFRLEDKHTPNYLAECFQRLFPTLGRMGLSTVIDEMARANSRCFGACRAAQGCATARPIAPVCPCGVKL